MDSADQGVFVSSPSIRGVLVIALIVRAAVILSSLMVTGGSSIGFINPDTRTYVEAATSLIGSGRFAKANGAPEIHRTPGYPLLLIPGIVLGHVELVTVFLQVLLSCLTTYIVYRIALHVLESERCAILAAAAYALEPVSILLSVKIVSETLFTTLVAAFLYSAVKWLHTPTLRHAVLAAIWVAGAIYVRPVAYYLPVLCAPVLFVRAVWHRRGRLKPVLQTMLFLFISLGAVGLWQVRNYRATGYPGFSANVERNLYYGEAALVLSVVRGVPLEQMQRNLGLEDELYFERHPENLLNGQGWWYRDVREAAFGVFRTHPTVYVANRLRAVMRTLINPGAFEYLVLYQVYPGERYLSSETIDRGIVGSALWFFRERPAHFWTNVVLAGILAMYYLAALLCLTSNRMLVRFPVAFLLFVAAYFVVFSLGSSRYRHPVMPILAVFAGCGLSFVINWYRRRRAPKTRNAAHESNG